MKVSSEKSKVVVNGQTVRTASIRMNGEELEQVSSFKYLGASKINRGWHQCQRSTMSNCSCNIYNGPANTNLDQ